MRADNIAHKIHFLAQVVMNSFPVQSSKVGKKATPKRSWLPGGLFLLVDVKNLV